MGQVAPEQYAGENFSNSEEIARPADIDDPWVRGMAEHLEEYWPGPSGKGKKR
jgi:hypothetical protein